MVNNLLVVTTCLMVLPNLNYSVNLFQLCLKQVVGLSCGRSVAVEVYSISGLTAISGTPINWDWLLKGKMFLILCLISRVLSLKRFINLSLLRPNGMHGLMELWLRQPGYNAEKNPGVYSRFLFSLMYFEHVDNNTKNTKIKQSHYNIVLPASLNVVLYK